MWSTTARSAARRSASPTATGCTSGALPSPSSLTCATSLEEAKSRLNHLAGDLAAQGISAAPSMRLMLGLALAAVFLACYQAGRQLSAFSSAPHDLSPRRRRLEPQSNGQPHQHPQPQPQPLPHPQTQALPQHDPARRVPLPAAEPAFHAQPQAVPQQPVASPLDISIVSFTNAGMLDFALNWLHHLRAAIGPAELEERLLMFVVGADAAQALLASGLIPAACIRDGTLGASGLGQEHGKEGYKYESEGFNKLAAQRPGILLAAIEERAATSSAVLYSDVDAVWRRDPLPSLRPLLEGFDVVGAQDTYLVCTGFFMFSTRSPLVNSLLRDWEVAIAAGHVVNQYVFNEKLKAFPRLRVHRLPHELFPSGMEFFHKKRHAGSALVVHANYFQGQDAKRSKLREASLWVDTQPQPAALPAAVPLPPPPITIISFTNAGMLDFALNWLHHLRAAIGPERLAASLLMYVVGADARRALLASGLVPAACIRDGSMGSTDIDDNHAQAGFKYESAGFNKLAAQRPRILLAAIEERAATSSAVLYSDVDAVWRRDPLPSLRPLLEGFDVVGAQDTYLVCTGFFMLSTRSKEVQALLSEWDAAISHGKVVNQYVFNEKLKAHPRLRVHRLPHELFPSGMEFFHKKRHAGSALVVHANYFQGQDAKRGKLREASLWVDGPRADGDAGMIAAAGAPAAVPGALPMLGELRAVHLATAGSQLSWDKLAAVVAAARRMECGGGGGGLLVFGGVADVRVLGAAPPRGCPVLLVDDSLAGAAEAKAAAAAAGMAHVGVVVAAYGGSYKEWEARMEDATWLMEGMPAEVAARRWGVVLVDGPYGGGAGRMKPIVWARQVVALGGSVFLDDLSRPNQRWLPPVEARYAARYYPPAVATVPGEGNNPGEMGQFICND
eukprot:jgi/Tetstr1/424528/TSEL_015056.t1